MMGSRLAGLIALLKKNRGEPDFFESVRRQIGEFESWEDEGDRFLTGKVRGLEILVGASGTVDCIFLLGPHSAEGREYLGDLPLGLKFRQSRKEVRAALGKPILSGKGGTFFGKVVFPWDKFDFPDYAIHVRYTCNGDGINRIALERVGTA